MTSQNRHFHSLNNRDSLCIRKLNDLAPNASNYREAQLKASQEMLEIDFKINTSISRTDSGKPILESGEYVSISHTENWIAMIVSDKIPVSIDIERIDRDLSMTKTRFTSDKEVSAVTLHFPKNPEIFIWSCKECLFKILNAEAVHFKEQLRFIEQVDKEKALWRVEHSSLKGNITVNYFIFEHLLVTYINELPQEI